MCYVLLTPQLSWSLDHATLLKWLPDSTNRAHSALNARIMLRWRDKKLYFCHGLCRWLNHTQQFQVCVFPHQRIHGFKIRMETNVEQEVKSHGEPFTVQAGTWHRHTDCLWGGGYMHEHCDKKFPEFSSTDNWCNKYLPITNCCEKNYDADKQSSRLKVTSN
jgi:hypothetical protein